MESYHKRKISKEKYGILMKLKPYNDSTSRKENKPVPIRRQLADIIDEEGLKNAYEAKDGLYQHCNKLLIAGTRDFPTDLLDD